MTAGDLKKALMVKVTIFPCEREQ